MGTQATLVYTVVALGIDSHKIQPFIADAEIPPEIISFLGLRVISDTTTAPGVNPIVRTVVLSFDPTLNGDGLPLIEEGRIEEVTVLTAGTDYIIPPTVTANNNDREPFEIIIPRSGLTIHPLPTQQDAIFEAFMNVQGATVEKPGNGYTAPTVTFLGGLPPANFDFAAKGGCVRYINIADPGEGYPLNPGVTELLIGRDGDALIQAKGILTLDSQGRVASIEITDMGSGYIAVPDVRLIITTGVAPKRAAKLYAVMAEGRPAQGTVTIDGAGHVTGLVITDPGDNYVEVPTVRIDDLTGTGAVVIARMGIGRIDVINPGEGYGPATTLSIVPAFHEYFPSADDQDSPFFAFLQGTIQRAAITPATSDAPLIT